MLRRLIAEIGNVTRKCLDDFVVSVVQKRLGSEMFEPSSDLRVAQGLLALSREANRAGPFADHMLTLGRAIRELVPCTSFSAVVLDPDAEEKVVDERWAVVDGAPLEVVLTYARKYLPVDPMRFAALQASGQPVTLSDFVSERQFGRDPYTDELLRPVGLRHLLGVSLRLSSRRILLFALHRRRGEGDFSPIERGILRLVAPDFAAAARHETIGVPQNESGVLVSLESREREVAEGALRGLANYEIARELGLSERTVGYYFTKLYRKLGVPDRPRLVALVTGQFRRQREVARKIAPHGPPRIEVIARQTCNVAESGEMLQVTDSSRATRRGRLAVR
jgi:DNA-binding CsgD family transcriptional regulator